MATDHVGALSKASEYVEVVRRGGRIDKPLAVRELTRFDVFTPKEISKIVGLSITQVKHHMGMQTNTSWSTRTWDEYQVSVLWQIALLYHNEGQVNMILIKMAAEACSLRAISELTGVPLDDVREAVNVEPYLLGLLRAGADTPSD